METTKPNVYLSNALKRSFLSIGLVILCLLFTTTAKAQVGFAIGPKGGVNVTDFSGDDNGNWSARAAWAAGLFANLQLGEVFSIQPEFLIQQKGASQTISGSKNTVRLNYFSVPLLFKLAVPIQGTFYPHIFAGPSYNYRLNAKATTSEGSISVSNSDLRRSEISGIAGVGLDVISNHVFFNIDARYNLGFSDVNKSNQSVNIKNRGMSFLVGIGYRFGSPK